MIKKYNLYTDAKFPWVSKFPSHWGQGKIKYIFHLGRGRVISKQELKIDGKYPVYSSQTKNDGCLGYIQTYDFEDDLLTWTTDGANAGEVFRRNGKFNCTNVCGTLKAKHGNIHLGYYYYLLKFLTPFYKRPDTNGAKIMNGEMAEIFTFDPPYEEQTKIAEYLDHQTGLIDSIIEKKKLLIQKLKEQRQAIINEAVTKGLDPNAPMKDSGVEWLGEIPEHWEIKPIKSIATYNDDTLKDSTPEDLELKYVEIGGVSLEKGIEEVQITNFKNAPSRARRIVRENDIIISTVRTYLKAITKIKYDQDGYIVSTGFAVVRPKKVISDFLGLVVQSENFIDEIIANSVGVSYPAINASDLVQIKIPVPNKAEQMEIADKLKGTTYQIFQAIKEIENSIEKIKVYRQSIISESVTGKIDVREWEPKVKEIA